MLTRKYQTQTNPWPGKPCRRSSDSSGKGWSSARAQGPVRERPVGNRSVGIEGHGCVVYVGQVAAAGPTCIRQQQGQQEQQQCSAGNFLIICTRSCHRLLLAVCRTPVEQQLALAGHLELMSALARSDPSLAFCLSTIGSDSPPKSSCFTMKASRHGGSLERTTLLSC